MMLLYATLYMIFCLFFGEIMKKREVLTQSDTSEAVLDNQFARARFTGDKSVLTRRILFTAISHINPFSEHLEAEYTVNLGELGAQSRDDAIRLAGKIVERLQSIKVKTELFDERWKGGYLLAVVMPSVKYNADGTLGIKFNEDLRGFLCDLHTKFTKVPLPEYIKLNTFYQQRLCEFLMSYRLTNHRKEVELQELYAFLGVPEKMQIWRSFQQRILRPAVDKINENTTMAISYEKQNAKNKITFFIDEKSAQWAVLKNEAISKKKEKKARLNHIAYLKRKAAKEGRELTQEELDELGLEQANRKLLEKRKENAKKT